MKLSEILQEAIEMQAYGLQSLIMFVVLEKKVLTFDDDEKELELYFKPNNTKRMNQLLKEYQEKLGIHHDSLFFQISTGKNNYIVKADNLDKASTIIKSKESIKSINLVDPKTELVKVDKRDHIHARYVLNEFSAHYKEPAVVASF